MSRPMRPWRAHWLTDRTLRSPNVRGRRPRRTCILATGKPFPERHAQAMSHAALIIQRPAGPARQLVLLFHGVGADEADLRPLGERLAREYPAALVASLRAPHRRSFGSGYQWFAIEGIDDASRIERVAAEMPAFVARVRQWQLDSGLGPEATVLI